MAKRLFEIKDLYQLKSISDPQISPDGSKVAQVRTTVIEDSDEYKSEIWVSTVDGGDDYRLTAGPSDGAPRWAPDSRRISFIRKADDGKPQVNMIAVDGGEASQLTSSTMGVAEHSWSPDGSKIAFTAITDLAGEPESDEERKSREKAPIEIDTLIFKADGAGFLRGRRRHLFIIDSSGGDEERLTEGDFDVSGLSWSPDGKEIAFSSAMHEERYYDLISHVFTVKLEGGSPRQVSEGKGIAAAPCWTPDGKTIIYAGQPQPDSARNSKLFSVPASGGEPVDIIPELDRNVMVGAPAYPGAAPQVSEDGSQVLFCVRDGGCVHIFSKILDGSSDAKKVIGGDERVVLGMTLAKFGERMTFVLSTPDIPSDVFISDFAGKNEKRLTSLNEEFLSQISVFSPQRRTFTAPDGVEIEGWVLSGRTEGDEPGPLLLDIHGGPHNAWGPYFPSTYLYRQVLAARGWTVLFINSRGSDGYGESFMASLTGGWGKHDFDDFMSAVDVLIEEGAVDQSKLALTGYSYGGFMTNWIVGHTERFAAAVTGGCVTNLQSMYGTSDFGSFLSWEIGGHSYEARDLYAHLSPINYVEKVTTPVLILHGQSDDRCPVGQAEEWYASLKQQKKEVEMVLYPGGSHLFIVQGLPSHRVDYANRIVDWVEGHTSARPEKSIRVEEKQAASVVS
jgi:dipeptidyl aminopeptidase/acylaminoacyl peptidase